MAEAVVATGKRRRVDSSMWPFQEALQWKYLKDISLSISLSIYLYIYIYTYLSIRSMQGLNKDIYIYIIILYYILLYYIILQADLPRKNCDFTRL